MFSSFTSFFAREIFFVTSSIVKFLTILVLIVRVALLIIPLAPSLVTSSVGSEVLVTQ